MSQKDRSAFKAGLFIVVSLLLIAGVIIGIKGFRTVFTPVVERHVRFTLKDDVGGLRVGDDVRLGGFKVGVIRKIEVQGLGDGATPSIVISFTMPVKYPLHDDSHLRVQGTLTGASWLNIDDLGGGPLLADAGELTGHPAALSQLFESLGTGGPELSSLLHDAHQNTLPELTALLQNVRQTTLPKINTTVDHAGEMSMEIKSLFGDTKPDIRGTMAHLNDLTLDVKEKLPGILDHVDGVLVKIGDTLDHAAGTLEDLKVTVANAKELSSSAKSVIVSNRGKLDGIIASLKLTSDNLKGASVELRRSPWRLFYKPAPGEVENLTLFDAAREFADGANGVNDAAQAVRDASQDKSVDKERMQKLMDKLNESFGNFQEVEAKLWKTVKE